MKLDLLACKCCDLQQLLHLSTFSNKGDKGVQNTGVDLWNSIPNLTFTDKKKKKKKVVTQITVPLCSVPIFYLFNFFTKQNEICVSLTLVRVPAEKWVLIIKRTALLLCSSAPVIHGNGRWVRLRPIPTGPTNSVRPSTTSPVSFCIPPKLVYHQI